MKTSLIILAAFSPIAIPCMALPSAAPPSASCHVEATIDGLDANATFATGTASCLSSSGAIVKEQPVEIAIQTTQPLDDSALGQKIFISHKGTSSVEGLAGNYNLRSSEMGMVGVQEQSGAEASVNLEQPFDLSHAILSVQPLNEGDASLVQEVAYRRGGVAYRRGGVAVRRGGVAVVRRGGVVVAPSARYCDPNYSDCGYYGGGGAVYRGGGAAVYRRGGVAYRGGGRVYHGGGRRRR